MKKLIGIILLLLCLVSCTTQQTRVEKQVEVIDKYTAIESKYDWFFESFKTTTVYYLVLENGDVEEVSKENYAKYQIGDLYTIVCYEVVE